MRSLNLAIAMVIIASCTDGFAPISSGASACETVADCTLGLVCHKTEGASSGRCLRSTEPGCGDGLVRDDIPEGVLGFEACDDGNGQNWDGCTNLCARARCGDGHKRLDLSAGEVGYEACDDGNTDEQDACSNDCMDSRCGDGIVREDLQAGAPDFEACDDGNRDNLDSCTNNCLQARCGDGVLRNDVHSESPDYEVCDDGNDEDLDRCDNDCRPTACGDGILQGLADEACDDGNGVNNDSCTVDCQEARCGDGILRFDLLLGTEGFETCDDGNEVDEDACPNDCIGGLLDVQSDGFGVYVLSADGTVLRFGRFLTPDPDDDNGAYLIRSIEPVPGLARSRQISAKNGSLCALLDDGSVQCLDPINDVMEPSADGPFRALSAGAGHQCSLDADGNVWCWGSNNAGQLGIRTEAENLAVPAQVEGLEPIRQLSSGLIHSCALTWAGGVTCWGHVIAEALGEAPQEGPPHSPPVDIPPARQLISMRFQTCALTNSEGSDAVWCWGLTYYPRGSRGEHAVFVLGETPPLRRLLSTSRGTAVDDDDDPDLGRGEFVIVETQDGVVGKLNRDGFVPITAPLGTRALAITSRSHCALAGVGLWCWGDDVEGGLGGTERGPGFPLQARELSNVVELALGRDHSCARLEDSTVRCWGSDQLHQLGNAADSLLGSLPVAVEGLNEVVQLAAGDEHTCARRQDGSVWCWGVGDARLGDGGNGEERGRVPVPVDSEALALGLIAGASYSFMLTAGENADEAVLMGWGVYASGFPLHDQSSPVLVSRLPPTRSVIPGYGHNCALLEDGDVACWGLNVVSQLGFENAEGQSFLTIHPPGIEPGWTEDRRIQGLGPMTELALGEAHTCARNEAGEVRCWGRNTHGTLGAVTTGENPHNLDMTPVPGLPAAQQIISGAHHNCARTANGAVACWGANDRGQLGDGETSEEAGEQIRMVVELPPARQLAAGKHHSCAVTEPDGEVWCWGANEHGQLGYLPLVQTDIPVQIYP